MRLLKRMKERHGIRAWSGRYGEGGYLVFRIVFAFLYACHGVQKLFGWFGEPREPFLSLQWFAGIIETFGGVLIGFGIFTSYAAFVASGEMAVAYFLVHFPRGVLPILNGGDNVVLFCFAWLFVFMRGGGRWSLDRLLRTESNA